MAELYETHRLLRGLDSLPTRPETARRLLELALDPAATCEEITAVVRTEPALAAELLRRVASSLPRTAEGLDLTLAARALEPADLRQWILTVGAAAEERRAEEQGPSGALRRHALAAAAAAVELAPAAGCPPEQAYTVALLASIGSLCLEERMPEEARELRARMVGRGEQRLLQLERELFGADHETMGLALAAAWGLPTALRDVLAFAGRSTEQLDRDCPQDTRELVTLVRAAAHVAARAGFPAYDGMRKGAPAADVALLVDSLDEEDLCARVRLRVEEAEHLLQPRARDEESWLSNLHVGNRELSRLLAQAERARRQSDSVIAVMQYGLRRLGDGDPLPGLMYHSMEHLGFRRMAHLDLDPVAGSLYVRRATALGCPERVKEGQAMAFLPRSGAFDDPAILVRGEGPPEAQRLLELLRVGSCAVAPLEGVASSARGWLCADRGPGGADMVAGEERCLAIIADQAAMLLRYDEVTREAERMLHQDPLTGAATRRRLMDRLDFLIAQTERTRWPLSLLMIDIDHFKQFNDTLGHQAGDRLLQEIVALLTANVRRTDIVARYGGDELAIVQPTVSERKAVKIAEELNREVESFGRKHADRFPSPLSISIGIATLRPGEDGPALIGRADMALYEAKRRGRNRVHAAA